MKVSFVDRLVKSGNIPIHLVRCKDLQGRDCWYFVMCSHQKIRMLSEIIDGEFDIADYGQILASGFGKEPSDDAKQALLENYDFDADSLM